MSSKNPKSNAPKAEVVDVTFKNPDTINKYRAAAEISQRVLKEVLAQCVEGALVVDICEAGDKLLEEEVDKIYRGKKLHKGIGHCTTVSPAPFVTPYTPIRGEEAEAKVALKKGEPVKVQLGAQVGGFAAIVCDTVIVGGADERTADLLLATHYANEVLLRLMVPAGTVEGLGEAKNVTQTRMTALLEKVATAYDVKLVESTTSWLFEHENIEASKKIVIAPGEGARGEGVPEHNEVWGVEVGMSLGAGKLKPRTERATLHRRTGLSYALKRQTSRTVHAQASKRFSTFPFSLRNFENERDAKIGAVECVRGNVFRQYEMVGDKTDGAVARLLSTVVITERGLQRLTKPDVDVEALSKLTGKKIEDEEILKILSQPLAVPKESKKDKAEAKAE